LGIQKEKIVGVILAAGLGMRLRPSTNRCPKPLIPVGGVEPLFFSLFKAYEFGIRKIVVNAFYLSERVEQALREWEPLFPGMEIRCSVEKNEILGTGGGILNILKEHSDLFQNCEGLLLQNGDTLAHFDFETLVGLGNFSSFAVSCDPLHLAKYNPLWVSNISGVWAGIGKSPPDSESRAAHFLGVHFLSGRDLALIQKNPTTFSVRPIDLFNGVYRPLVNLNQTPQSVEFFKDPSKECFWFDMTTQEFLLEAQRHVLESFSSSKTWGKVLMSRFPFIQEISRGVWVKSPNPQRKSIQFTAPVVFVDNEGEDPKTIYAPLKIGPHASFIHEKGPVVVVTPHSPEDPVEIVNSVVFTGNSSTDTLDKQIRDKICVL
jgi:NDP-sugar pyrophosphorylase family protein